MQKDSVRDLIFIPVIHTQADLGSLSESVRQLYIQRMGSREWDHRLRTVEEMWRGISRAIESLELGYSKVRLYQDGLPNCGHEAAIVRDMAQAGSQNHQLLLELMEKGAKIVGTESPELLLEEYELARQTLTHLTSGESGGLKRGKPQGAPRGSSQHEGLPRGSPARLNPLSGASLKAHRPAPASSEVCRAEAVRGLNGREGSGKLLLERRDRYIAERINETLGMGETGLVFIGLLHSLDGLLAPDIKVIQLSGTQRT